MSTRIIPVANVAGSAGKTTTVIALATLLAQDGVNVAVCDFDPQANATTALNVDTDEVKWSSAQVLLRECDIADALVDTDVPGLRLLPASRSDMDHHVYQLQSTRFHELRFRSALASLDDDVEVVLVDCPGQLNSMTLNALVAATSVVTVTKVADKEMSGIPILEDVLEGDIRALTGSEVRIGAIVPTQVLPASRGKIFVESQALLRETYGDLVTPAVRDSVKVAGAYSHRVPLPVFAPSEPVTQDYRAVLEHLRGLGVL